MALVRHHASLARSSGCPGRGARLVADAKAESKEDAKAESRTDSEESETMKAQLLTMSTPDGPFTIIARDGAVLSSGWTAVPGELTGQIHADLLPADFETVTGLGDISEAVEA